MEHYLIVLVVELCRWIDRHFQKTLGQAVPDLEAVLVDPRGALAARDIAIGPARRYVTGLMLGLIAGLIADGAIVLIFILARDGANQRPTLEVPFSILLAALPLLCLWLVFHLLRGGRMLLTATGVEMSYRSTVVRCPWSLFSSPGQPFPVKDRVLIPILPEARRFVEVQTKGILQTTRQVKTHQLRFESRTEALLHPLYEVNVAELAGFLLVLGRAMGSSLPAFSSAPEESEPEDAAGLSAAVMDQDGWITARLTRLTFPPFCCDCGVATDETQVFQGHSQALRIGKVVRVEGGEHATFAVPVCGECRRENRFRNIKGSLVGALIGLSVATVLALALALWLRDPRFLFVLIPMGAFGIAIGAVAGKSQSAPVQMERYSAAKGTIAIRFRWREYGQRLVAYMEAQETLV